MRFKDNKAIYLQIADLLCEDILQGKYAEDEKILSVRELASTVEVNANTCARAYDYLQSLDIIYTKRGLGYFISNGARQAVIQMLRNEFMNETLPNVVRQMNNLNISVEELNTAIINLGKGSPSASPTTKQSTI